MLDDGLIGLEVTDINKDKREIVTKVMNSGTLKTKRRECAGRQRQSSGNYGKDANDIVFGIEQGVDFIAASFVRRPSDVLEIRELLEEHNAADIQIIPKSKPGRR
ncbi:pyruvate kinase [Bacillus licheniformis]|nr:pyruvate kinase [Bacillus licheniformis]